MFVASYDARAFLMLHKNIGNLNFFASTVEFNGSYTENQQNNNKRLN